MRGVLVAASIVMAGCGGAKAPARAPDEPAAALCPQCSCDEVPAGTAGTWTPSTAELRAAVAGSHEIAALTCQGQFDTSRPGDQMRATAEACVARGKGAAVVCGVGEDEGGVCCRLEITSAEIDGRRYLAVDYPGISDGQMTDVYEVRAGELEPLCLTLAQWSHYLCTGTNSGGFRACPELDAAWPTMSAAARSWVCTGSTDGSEAVTTEVVPHETIAFAGEQVGYQPVVGQAFEPMPWTRIAMPADGELTSRVRAGFDGYRAALRRGRGVDKARVRLIGVLAKGARDAAAELMYGLLLDEAGRRAEAMAAFERCAAQDTPRAGACWYLAGLMHEGAGEVRAAAQAYLQAIPRVTDPTFGSELHLRLGRAFLVLGAPWSASEALERVVAPPSRVAALHALAWAYFSPGRYHDVMKTVARLRAEPGVSAGVLADVERLEALCLADPVELVEVLREEDPAAKDLPAAAREAAAAYFAGAPATTRERLLWWAGRCAGLRAGFAHGPSTTLTFVIESTPGHVSREIGGADDPFVERVTTCIDHALYVGPAVDADVTGSIDVVAR